MNALTESTAAERAEMIAAGMVEISRADWLARVSAAGYRVEKANCFDYANRGNRRPYLARAVYYCDLETGMSWAHFQGRRDSRFRALQEMRGNCFVFERGRIYEL
jgi:hypothetical protein